MAHFYATAFYYRYTKTLTSLLPYKTGNEAVVQPAGKVGLMQFLFLQATASGQRTAKPGC